MGARLDQTMRGLLIPDPRCIVPDNLAANDGSATGSSYTEAGPRPGSATTSDPKARLVPEITGGQSVDAKIAVMRGGNPGRDGCRVLWRPESDADADYRGWNHPCLLTGWTPVAWSATYTIDLTDIVVAGSTPVPIALYGQNANGWVQSRAWDWSTDTWGPLLSVMASASGARYVAGLVLPSGRVLCASVGDIGISVSYTDDLGSSWHRYGSTYVNLAGTGIARGRMAQYADDIVLLMGSTSGIGEYQQWASSDLGTSYSLVETGTIGHTWSCFSMPGGIGVAYIDGATLVPKFRRLSSAFSEISASSAVTIDTGAVLASLVVYADDDGTLYAIGRSNVAGVKDTSMVWFSRDLGDTWTAYERDSLTSGTSLLCAFGDDANYVTVDSVAPVRGWAVATCLLTASVSAYSGSLCAAWLGGWSSVVCESAPGYVRQTHEFLGIVDDQRMMGWGWDEGATDTGRTWVPVELPGNITGWTTVGAAGVITAAGGMQISTVTASGYYLHQIAAPDLSCSCMCEVRVDSGGSTTADDIVVHLVFGDGTDELDVWLRLSTTGYSVWDATAGAYIGSTVTRSMTSYTQIMVSLVFSSVPGTAAIDVWHKAPRETVWGAGPAGAVAVNTATPGTSQRLEFGHITATAASQWRMFCYRYTDRGNVYWQQRPVSRGADNVGRALNGLPYPIPEIGTATEDAALRLVSGPGRVGDVFDLTASHDYPIEAILPAVEPSPSVAWRSTSKAEQIVAIDLTDLTSLGGYTVALCLQGANFRTAYLEGWNGIAWVTIGTYDGAEDFSAAGLTFDLDGDTARPGTTVSTSDGGRYIHQGEFVGGYLWMDNVATLAREIGHNRAGLWADRSTTTATLRLLGIDGAEDTDGTAMLVSPSGVLIVHLDEDTHHSRFRLRIPASQVTPWSYYQIGTMVLGYVVAWGKQHGDGWVRTPHRTAEDSTSRRGTRRIIQRGPMTEDWSVSWPNMVDLRQLRTAVDLDYLGPSAGIKAPLVARDDVWWLLDGVLREIKSGEYPVVALARVPAADAMITDPTLYLYGTTDSTPETTSVVGDEGESEVVRIGSLLVRGQV